MDCGVQKDVLQKNVALIVLYILELKIRGLTTFGTYGIMVKSSFLMELLLAYLLVNLNVK
jgi:hypothetical protein